MLLKYLTVKDTLFLHPFLTEFVWIRVKSNRDLIITISNIQKGSLIAMDSSEAKLKHSYDRRNSQAKAYLIVSSA